MTLQNIAENITTSTSYNESYRKEMESKPWLKELIDEGYDAMCSKIKHISNGKEYLTYNDAATIMDKVALTVVAIYDKYLAELEKNFDDATP